MEFDEKELHLSDQLQRYQVAGISSLLFFVASSVPNHLRFSDDQVSPGKTVTPPPAGAGGLLLLTSAAGKSKPTWLLEAWMQDLASFRGFTMFYETTTQDGGELLALLVLAKDDLPPLKHLLRSELNVLSRAHPIRDFI